MSDTFTIIVPAHDEADVIAATLAHWATGFDSVTVIVVCNACSDATATMARQGLSTAWIIETPDAGKANAINLGLAAAPVGPVLIVDADVAITPAALRGLAAVLQEPGVCAASPAVLFDLAGADRLVRGYYRAFRNHPYVVNGVGGAGVYGLSVEGRRRIGSFPLLLSDDDYVRHFFSADEQRRVAVDPAGLPVAAIVSPPRHWHELVRTEARWRAGDGMVRTLGSAGSAASSSRARLRCGSLAQAWRAGQVPLSAMAAYVGIKLLGRGRSYIQRLRRRSHVWHRDQSSRAARSEPVSVER